MSRRPVLPFWAFYDEEGLPLSGAKLYAYETGTSTPKNTYSQEDLDPGSVNTNPVVADASGRFGEIFLENDTSYKFILRDSDGNEVWSADPVEAFGPQLKDWESDESLPADKDDIQVPWFDLSDDDKPKRSGIQTLVESVFGAQYSTGDLKPTLKATADTGWVMADDRTIGDASSGATNRANIDCEDLFTLLWNNLSNTEAPVQDSGGTPTTRGATAAADWAAHRRISLPKMLGRALGIAGAGSGLTSRTLGVTVGEETHALVANELPDHTHPYSLAVGLGGAWLAGGADGNPYASYTTTDSSVNASTETPHNNMQPTSFINLMVKL